MRTLRWTGAVVLLVISSLLVVSALAARFARSELLDTDRYVATVAPLASDPAVQAAVTTRVSAEIVQAADIPALTQQLADSIGIKGSQQAATLATPAITGWVTDQITKIVGELVSSPKFVTLWTEANRAAHNTIENILTGQNGPIVSTQSTDIIVDLGAVLAAAKDALIAKGWTFLTKIPDRSIPYTVAHVEQLPKIQRAVSLLQKAAIWLPILALILLGLAVWCAPNHRRALLIGLLITAGLLAVVLVAAIIARDRYADRITAAGLNLPAALVVWDAVLKYLVIAVKTVAVTALLGAAWAFLAGPGRLALGFRRATNSVLDRLARAIGPQSGLRAFIRRWQNWLTILIAVASVWWLLTSPTTSTAIVVTATAALAAAALTLLRRLPDSPVPG